MSSFAVLGKGPRGPPGPPGDTTIIPVAHFTTHDELTGSSAETVVRNWNWGGTGEPGAISADDMYLVCFSIYGQGLTSDLVTDARVEWLPEPQGAEGLSQIDAHGGEGIFCISGTAVVGGADAAIAALILKATCPNSTKTEVWGNVLVWKVVFPASGEIS